MSDALISADDAAAAVRGFAIAVFGTAALTSAAIAILYAAIDGQAFDASDAIAGFGMLFAAASVATAVAMLTIGLPLTVLFARAGIESLPVYPLSGFFAGAGLMLLLQLWLMGDLIHMGNAAFCLVGAVPGALCGWLWWTFNRARVCRERAGD